MERLTRSTITKSLSRRRFLAGTATTVLATPFLARSAAAAGEVIIRSSGGAIEDNNRKTIWGPFEMETGIKVVPAAATAGKLFAMFKSGNVELDVIDIGAGPLVNLNKQGALASIDFKGWKTTNPDDISPAYKDTFRVGNSLYASVIGYNKLDFPDSHPRSWAEFWDVAKFPAPRSLQDIGAGNPDLEFALIADGVPRDKLYPLDLDRAFASLSRIRESVPKFWDTGALSTQMLVDREVSLSTIWSSRIKPAIASGAPLAIEWQDHLVQVQSYSIFKNAKNMENAQKYVEFALRPDVHAAQVIGSGGGATNAQAAKLLPAGYGANSPGSKELEGQGIVMDVNWWEDNRADVTRRWGEWIQQ